MNLSERDKKLIWHPFTQEKTESLPVAIKRASGSYLYDWNDKSYLDLISSWWVNLHGHCQPDIARSIYEQALKLEHVMFAGFTHQPAVELCELLKQILPQSLTKFFFSDNGSTSVEVALKMAYQYWFNNGEKERQLFMSFDGGYHGDTFGAMSVGAKSGFHDHFKDLFFKVLSLPFPSTWDGDQNIESKETYALECLEDILQNHKNKIAAIILEPLVQGASGMRMCRPEFLKIVLERVRQHGILIIYDEVMTGFGRTGTNFALEQIGIVPDFLCVSKGITGGFLPLALTITTDQIYNGFLNDNYHYAFAHGHSYTANPLACSAAIASFHLLTSNITINAIKEINAAHNDGIAYLKNLCNIQNTRILGTIAAFETNYSNKNQILGRKFLEQGLLIRPLGNIIYLLPPYSTTGAELQHAYQQIAEIINIY